MPDQVLQTALVTPLPLRLPTPTGAGEVLMPVEIGFLSLERITELDDALDNAALPDSDREVLAAAVQFRHWLRLAWMTDRSLLLFRF